MCTKMQGSVQEASLAFMLDSNAAGGSKNMVPETGCPSLSVVNPMDERLSKLLRRFFACTVP